MNPAHKGLKAQHCERYSAESCYAYSFHHPKAYHPHFATEETGWDRAQATIPGSHSWDGRSSRLWCSRVQSHTLSSTSPHLAQLPFLIKCGLKHHTGCQSAQVWILLIAAVYGLSKASPSLFVLTTKCDCDVTLPSSLCASPFLLGGL